MLAKSLSIVLLVCLQLFILTCRAKQVTLIYAYTNSSGTWIKVVDMTNLEGNVWNTTVPAFSYCTNITYVIITEDNANNTITTEEMGYEYHYHVIPEFSSFLLMPLFMSPGWLKRKAERTP